MIDVGDVTAQAAYAAGKIRLNSAVVSEAGGGARHNRALLTDFAYDPQPPLSGVARWNELRFQRLRDLFAKSPLALRGSGLKIADTLNQLRLPLTGSISGQANLSGTIGRSERGCVVEYDRAENRGASDYRLRGQCPGRQKIRACAVARLS